MFAHRLTVLVLLLAYHTLSAAEEPTKHPRYEEFHKARLVMVAKLESATVTALQESFPPRYIYAVSLMPVEVLRGNFEKGKAVKCSFTVASATEPKLPVGKEILVQLEAAPKSGHRIVKIEEPAAELKEVAKAAAKAGQEQESREDELARKEPEKHPRFKDYKDAVGVAILSLEEKGVAAFDISTRTTVLSTKAEEVLKGDLKAGMVKVYIPSKVKPPLAKKWLVTFKLEGNKVMLLSAEEASETLLLVSRAATRK
jgi:hypothetical protein